LPAAGFPGSRGGNVLTTRASHFFATSAAIAHAFIVIDPIAIETDTKSEQPISGWSSWAFSSGRNQCGRQHSKLRGLRYPQA
jgi:hypothetical protein